MSSRSAGRVGPDVFIVMGGGQVGYHLTRTLMLKEHEVLLVEKDPRRAARITGANWARSFEGDGCEFRIAALEQKAPIEPMSSPRVTGDDEDNLVMCQLSKRKFGVSRTIARVNDPAQRRDFPAPGDR